MRSGNPTLKETTFQDLGAFSEIGMNWVNGASARSTVMTIQDSRGGLGGGWFHAKPRSREGETQRSVFRRAADGSPRV